MLLAHMAYGKWVVTQGEDMENESEIEGKLISMKEREKEKKWTGKENSVIKLGKEKDNKSKEEREMKTIMQKIRNWNRQIAELKKVWKCRKKERKTILGEQGWEEGKMTEKRYGSVSELIWLSWSEPQVLICIFLFLNPNLDPDPQWRKMLGPEWTNADRKH